MVRQRSAKPLYGGSIPPQASRKLREQFSGCPGDGTGIRSRLKIGGRKACGFDSHPGQNRAERDFGRGETRLREFRWKSNGVAMFCE